MRCECAAKCIWFCLFEGRFAWISSFFPDHSTIYCVRWFVGFAQICVDDWTWIKLFSFVFSIHENCTIKSIYCWFCMLLQLLPIWCYCLQWMHRSQYLHMFLFIIACEIVIFCWLQGYAKQKKAHKERQLCIACLTFAFDRWFTIFRQATTTATKKFICCVFIVSSIELEAYARVSVNVCNGSLHLIVYVVTHDIEYINGRRTGLLHYHFVSHLLFLFFNFVWTCVFVSAFCISSK